MNFRKALRTLFKKSVGGSGGSGRFTWQAIGGSAVAPHDPESMYAAVGWLYRAVTVCAQNVASVPVRAVRRRIVRGEVKLSPLPDAHPLVQLLRNPNELDDLAGVIETTVLHLLLRGESLWVLDGDGKTVTNIQVVPPQNIVRVEATSKGYHFFEYRDGGEIRRVSGDNAIFFRRPNPSTPTRGLAPTSALQNACATDFAAQRYNVRTFTNAPSPGLVLSLTDDGTHTQEEKERISTEISRQFSGTDTERSQGVLILGKDEKAEITTPGFKDGSWGKLRDLNRIEIQATLGVPEILLSVVQNANRANSQSQLKTFWCETLIPIIRDMESLLNRKLAPRYGSDVVILFDVSTVAAMQTSLDEVMAWALPAIEAGLVTINEIRTEHLKKPEVPWGFTPDGSEGTDADPLRSVPAAVLAEWKNAAANRIKDGAQNPEEAFPLELEAAKAEKSGVPRDTALRAALQARKRLAVSWPDVAAVFEV